MFADAINTVSPTYAKEILTGEFGEKLNELLAERRSSLYGILNGIDTNSFNPETDSNITANYSAGDLSARIQNKVTLQKHFGLPPDEKKFVIGIVSRMDAQKGFDLIIKIADSLMQNIDFQLVVVGTGSNEYRCFFQELANRHPQKAAGHFFFDNKLPRMVFAGADSILIPSRFEPSGLVQMEAMRYGAVPIVRKTGGLADSVKDYVPGENKGTGFVFNNYDQYALLIAIIRASEAYRHQKEWVKLIKRAMAEDFSWKKSANEYVKLFNLVLNFDQKQS